MELPEISRQGQMSGKSHGREAFRGYRFSALYYVSDLYSLESKTYGPQGLQEPPGGGPYFVELRSGNESYASGRWTTFPTRAPPMVRRAGLQELFGNFLETLGSAVQ